MSLRSKIQLSEKFINIIAKMKNNKIAHELIRLNSTELDTNFKQNYIDIGDSKDEVTFITDKKAREIMGSDILKYVVTHGSKTLTHSGRNKSIFKKLGYISSTETQYKPEVGEVGIIKSETNSVFSSSIYALFVTENGNQTVINKTSLGIHRTDKSGLLWTKNRNPIKIGRLVRSILKATNFEFSEKEIEDFVNIYKSAYDVLNSMYMQFDIIKGDDIAYWYSSKNYHSNRSTLGGSCMANVKSSYFDLYTQNTQCSLVILYNDNGVIENGKYKSSKIKGRALLWKTDQGDIFLDRIYTNNDSDVQLFMNFAIENGWWYKTYQNTSSNFTTSNGKTSKIPEYSVTLDKCKFNHYPYLDTLSYINFSNTGTITNDTELLTDTNAELHSTNGYLNTYDRFPPDWVCCEDTEDEEFVDEGSDELDDDLPY